MAGGDNSKEFTQTKTQLTAWKGKGCKAVILLMRYENKNLHCRSLSADVKVVDFR